jgi:hypothetical protein
MEVLMKNHKRNYSLHLFLLLALTVAGLSFLPNKTVYAAPSQVTVYAVNYYDENIEVFNNENTKIYFATEIDAAKNNWEVMEAESGDTTIIDISWTSPNTENIICIKGEENSKQTRIVLKPMAKKLEVAINYGVMTSLAKNDTIAEMVNIMTTEGSGSKPITFEDLEWKKSEGGRWMSTDDFTVSLLEKLLIKGAYVYFRIKAEDEFVDMKYNGADFTPDPDRYYGFYYEDELVPTNFTYGNDYPDGTKGRRASKEVKVKLAKTAPPMVYGIDGEDFTADIKYGKEYRVTRMIGSTEVRSGWNKVTDRSVKNVPLATIVSNGTSDGTTALKAFPAMKIEVRNYATSKAAASKISVIELNAQRVLTSPIVQGPAPLNTTAADNNIYISYNGTKNLAVTIPSASTAHPFEYCIVKPTETFDLTRAVWTPITKGTEVKVLPTKAVDGGVIYIRQKEIKSKKATSTSPAVAYSLASTYVTYNLNYPAVPEITNTSYVFTKGYSDAITFSIKLNIIGKKPFETEIRNIKLGTKEIAFTSTVTPAIPNPVSASQVYTMNVTLTKSSLEAMVNSFARPITITYMNGTVDKTSIKLTIQNPTPAGTLTANPAQGSATGTTAITVVNTAALGNEFVYTKGANAVTGKYTSDAMTSGTAFTSGADISVTANEYITVYEINSTTKNIVRYKSIQISASNIK